MVFTKDPDTGERNCGMYRMHVYDATTTGMHWHMHKDGARHYRKAEQKGERLEVAVAIGSDPAVMYSSTAPLPEGIDEMLFAGFLRNNTVDLVKCETVDLEVPANAEIVLEGYCEPGERRLEGPFGDHTGYYSLADEYPVFHVTCITHRKDAIYPATIVGKPPMEDCFIGKATERIFLPLLKKQLPEIEDMNLPLEGVFHNLAVISIDKRYPGHARKVMYALWGMGQMSFTKAIVIVDKWVDVQNLSEVVWRMGNNVDPKRDTVIIEGPLDVLEHASDIPAYGGKMGIDATKKLPSEGFTREWPDEIVMSEEIKRRATERWKEYGFE
jgi:4-hydroxy-3-polyprenylbenzoate decarboxylase